MWSIGVEHLIKTNWEREKKRTIAESMQMTHSKDASQNHFLKKTAFDEFRYRGIWRIFEWNTSSKTNHVGILQRHGTGFLQSLKQCEITSNATNAMSKNIADNCCIRKLNHILYFDNVMYRAECCIALYVMSNYTMNLER